MTETEFSSLSSPIMTQKTKMILPTFPFIALWNQQSANTNAKHNQNGCSNCWIWGFFFFWGQLSTSRRGGEWKGLFLEYTIPFWSSIEHFFQGFNHTLGGSTGFNLCVLYSTSAGPPPPNFPVSIWWILKRSIWACAFPTIKHHSGEGTTALESDSKPMLLYL